MMNMLGVLPSVFVQALVLLSNNRLDKWMTQTTLKFYLIIFVLLFSGSEQ